MGGFDKYVSRFDELETKKGKGAPAGGAERKGWSRRTLSAWVGALGLLLVAAGVVYGPSLAGAAGPATLDVGGPEAEQDFQALRAMKFPQVQQLLKDRMARRAELRTQNAPQADIDAAKQAAWRASQVARELSPD
jgi:hypothetical protein